MQIGTSKWNLINLDIVLNIQKDDNFINVIIFAVPWTDLGSSRKWGQPWLMKSFERDHAQIAAHKMRRNSPGMTPRQNCTIEVKGELLTKNSSDLFV